MRKLNHKNWFIKGSVELTSSNSYFIDAVIEEVISDLQKERCYKGNGSKNGI